MAASARILAVILLMAIGAMGAAHAGETVTSEPKLPPLEPLQLEQVDKSLDRQELISRGEKAFVAGTYKAAIAWFSAALEVDAKKPPKSVQELAQVHLWLGRSSLLQGRYQDAKRYLQSGKSLLKDDACPLDLDFDEALGDLYVQAGYYIHAEKVFRTLLEKRRAASGEDGVPFLRTQSAFGETLQLQRRFMESEVLVRGAFKKLDEKLGETDPVLQYAMFNLAKFLWGVMRVEEADSVLKRLIASLLSRYGPVHPELVEPYEYLGDIIRHAGDYDEAFRVMCKGMDICEKTLGRIHPIYPGLLNGYAILAQKKGMMQEAEEAFKEASQTSVLTRGPWHHYHAIDLSNYGFFLCRQKRYEEAEKQFRDSLAAYEAAFGPDHGHSVVALMGLGMLYDDTGNMEKHEEVLKKIVEIRRKNAANEKYNLAAAYVELAEFFGRTGRKEEGVLNIEAAEASLKEITKRDPYRQAGLLFRFYLYYRTAGQAEKAKKFLDIAIEYLKDYPSAGNERAAMYLFRALDLLDDGDVGAAEAAMEQSVQAGKEATVAQYAERFAKDLVAAGSRQAGLKWLRKAGEMYRGKEDRPPDKYLSVKEDIAYLEFNEEEYEAALGSFKELVVAAEKFNLENTAARISWMKGIAVCLLRQGKEDEAMKWVAKYKALEPEKEPEPEPGEKPQPAEDF